jgi:hypothetical protein
MLTPTTTDVLKILRQLPAHEQLHVISLALPEIEKSLGNKIVSRKSLLGLWKDLGPSISADVIDNARHEMWQNFPRGDLI